MIIDHDHPEYRKIWESCGVNKYNGAFYYSKEIVKNIIPHVRTDRSWVTVKIEGVAADHAIVFIHNNLRPDIYDYLKEYKDLILVCGVPETCAKVAHLGRAIYLPLSIDVEYVEQFRIPEEEKKGAAYVGRPEKRRMGNALPADIDYLMGMKRQNLLALMAMYETVYAVGRTAIEARALGCQLKVYDPRYPDTDFWKVLDNKDAAIMLQEKIDEIDGPERRNG